MLPRTPAWTKSIYSHYNLRIRDRHFEIGKHVLVLMPDSTSSKWCMAQRQLSLSYDQLLTASLIGRNAVTWHSSSSSISDCLLTRCPTSLFQTGCIDFSVAMDGYKTHVWNSFTISYKRNNSTCLKFPNSKQLKVCACFCDTQQAYSFIISST